MFLIKNYNRYIVNRGNVDEWEDFGSHRHPSDLLVCRLFSSEELAEEFIESHPDLFHNYEGWILVVEPENWLNVGNDFNRSLIIQQYIPLFEKAGIECSTLSRTAQNTSK